MFITNTVMVRQVALIAEHRGSSSTFDLQEGFEIIFVSLGAGVGEVEAAANFVLMSGVTTDPTMFAFLFPDLANSFLDRAPQLEGFGVENRSFEDVSPQVV
jgi:hypothetical protein